MKAVIYEAFKGSLQIREVLTPKATPHGVVVKIRATTIGPLPLRPVPGHIQIACQIFGKNRKSPLDH